MSPGGSWSGQFEDFSSQYLIEVQNTFIDVLQVIEQIFIDIFHGSFQIALLGQIVETLNKH